MFEWMRRKDDLIGQYLEEQIEYCAEKMLTLDPDSDEYRKTNEQFMRFVQAKEEKLNGRKIKPETWALIGSNLAGILIVLHYERIHVVTSKAFSWIVRPKL